MKQLEQGIIKSLSQAFRWTYTKVGSDFYLFEDSVTNTTICVTSTSCSCHTTLNGCVIPLSDSVGKALMAYKDEREAGAYTRALDLLKSKYK